MATVFKPKRSETASSVPTTGNLSVGEMAVNTADQKIYVRDSADNIVVVADSAAAAAGISDVVEDTTPQLGGDLDGQGNKVEDVELDNYKETIHALGSTDSPTIDVANGNVQSVTITSGLSIPTFTNAETGQSVTLLVTGSGTATGGTGYKFAGGNTTLTSFSVVSVFYDGTTYWSSIATDFQ